MRVKIINTDDRIGEENYVELTQEQYDRFKALEEKYGMLCRARDEGGEVFEDELFRVTAQPPDDPELYWYC